MRDKKIPDLVFFQGEYIPIDLFYKKTVRMFLMSYGMIELFKAIRYQDGKSLYERLWEVTSCCKTWFTDPFDKTLWDIYYNPSVIDMDKDKVTEHVWPMMEIIIYAWKTLMFSAFLHFGREPNEPVMVKIYNSIRELTTVKMDTESIMYYVCARHSEKTIREEEELKSIYEYYFLQGKLNDIITIRESKINKMSPLKTYKLSAKGIMVNHDQNLKAYLLGKMTWKTIQWLKKINPLGKKKEKK